MKKSLIALLMVGGLSTLAAAETADGVLEKGPVYSALFSVSAESGDLVGYAFKNQSPVGKLILKNCLPGMLCQVEQSALRSPADESALKFSAQPSGWLEITKGRNAGMVPAVAGYDKAAKTRYGTVSVQEEDNILLFKGKPVKPTVTSDGSLSIVASYQAGKADLLLVQSTGGNACPAQFRVVKVEAGGLRVSPEFGTCSDIIYPTLDEQNHLNVAMVSFSGTALSKTTYQWRLDGRLTENGKPVR